MRFCKGRERDGEIWVTCPDAACRPRPRLPPVTTTTFPFRENMFGKSLSSVSYFMLDMANRDIKYNI